MQQQIKTVSQFFKIMIGSFQEQKPDQFIEALRMLVLKQVEFPVDKLKGFESLNAYKQGNKDREVYQILDSIRLWAISRTQSEKERVKGFTHYLNVLSHGLKYLEDMKEGQQWFVNCLKMLILFSKKAFDEAQVAAVKIGQSTEKVLETFFQQLRQYKSSRSIEPQAKRELGLLIQTMQVSINFKMLNYSKCERGLELIKRDLALYRPEKLNLFWFQYGKLCLVSHRFKQSQSCFQKILALTPRQKRIVLRYLIPCKIFLGKMCIDTEFPEYLELTKSVISGNFGLFEHSIQKYQKLWIKRGLYLLIEKMRMLVWRNFLKRTSTAVQNFKINMDHIVAAVKVMGGKENVNECICIISNLIYEGYVKGYIFCGETSKILVLKNEGAFVPLTKVFQ